MKVAAAIAAQMTPPRNAQPTDRSVTLTGGATFSSAQSPLRIAGAAPGGTITGIAFVNDVMYAVSTNGGLFRVNNPGSPRNASATYIPTSAQDLQGINFHALTAGPVLTEGGRYEEMLFGMDRTGRIYAFDTTGRLQPVFVNGQSSFSTGLVGLDGMLGVHGMAFSTLEENPWKIVNGDLGRAFDPGHGLELTFDQSRYEPNFRVDGNASLHFGPAPDIANNTAGTYDWPGGAHGSLESFSFSLAGYTAADKPVLYFNYWAQTEQESSDPATQTPMLDSLRVFIGDSSGRWDLLATNNSYEIHELNRPRTSAAQNAVQELYDNNTGWRQVRIELDNYAGRDNLQIRIDFATAGTMNVGDPTTTGSELRILPGSALSDGQTFVVSGVTFEIDMGYTLVVPSGAAISDGDTLRITRGLLEDKVFEFDASGNVSDPSHVPIQYFGSMTPDELAAAIEQAVRGEFAGFRVSAVGNRINLPDADLVTPLVGTAVRVVGSPGTTGVPVVVDSSMLATQVAAVVQQALADRFANGVTQAFKRYDHVVRVIGRTVTNSGPFGLTSSLPGDGYGNFFSNLRGQDNVYEGIYLDDFIIGFAERGEVGINAAGLTTFYENPGLLPNQILTGPYQLEVRQAEKYGVSRQGPDRLVLARSFDTNARLSESYSLFASPANEISDGQTFTLSDGLNSMTFEFDDVNIGNGVTPGNVRIPFNPMMLNFATGDRRPQTASEVAAAIRDAINSPAVQSVLKITAALSDGAVTSSTPSTSSIVNLFGAVDAEVIEPVLSVTSTTTDGNQLRDALLGGVFQPVGDAVFVGGSNSAGFFVGGGTSIGIAQGIVLTTGDARSVQGPNTSDGSTGSASLEGDADLDAYFAPLVTLDSTSLEFSFLLQEPGDLFFEFVFSSEEYNEFVGSEFNDVFAFFLNGENIAFVPGSRDPVTINTVNGGNPFGTGGVNAEYFNNNDRDEGGLYLDVFGHDGFTDVFTASMFDLPAGVHTIKLAIADVGDTALDSAVFIRAFNLAGPDPRTQIRGVVNTDKGDRNHVRDQGQVIIHSNTISGSLGYGIVVGPGERSPEGKPHAGPVRVTRQLNLNNLVPGVVLANNLIARNAQGGISFSGDQNIGSVAAGTVPFGRIVNNTIYGGTTGILVQHNASPTLLNNIVADNAVGIAVDASSSSTVIGGTLYAGPGVRSSNGNLGDSPIFVAQSNDLFINKDLGNFYPRPNSPAIDSSFDSLLDRPAMVTIRQPLGIASSPILAPDFDLYGQRRVDDPDVASPSGLGQNVFKDRGAIDRSDFSGPSAIIVNPRDNDVLGKDQDGRDTYVELKKETLFNFSIQLIDGVPPSNDSYGSGPDRNTVLPQTVIVTRDGVPLQEGGDYRFSYDATSAIIRLTPLAGIWEPDHAYEIHLLNVDTLVIAASTGGLVSDGDRFTVATAAGASQVFEFESGYSLVVPAAGGSAITDGTTFLITRNGSTTPVTTTFEFDRNGSFRPNNVVVRYETTDTADTIAAAIATAIRNAGLNLTPQAYEGGIVHVGGTTQMVLDVNNTSLIQRGLPGVALGNVAVPFVPHVSFTAAQMAASIASAINGGALAGVTAEARENQVVVVGADSILGIANVAVGAIKDLAGNRLQPNRFDGSTVFTVFLGSGFDYGDAPSPYPVLKADNGARHEVVDGFMLGNSVFATVDGQPSANADADPGDNGVVFSTLTVAYSGQISVTARGITVERPGYLDAWIDFNGDGDWNDPGEKIFDSVLLVEGTNSLTFDVPTTAVPGATFARFRLSSSGGLAPTGPASDGEVEDYRVVIHSNPWQNPLNRLDVNGDSFVSAIDALLIINLLNFNPGIWDTKLPVPPAPGFAPPPYYDVNGDGFVSAIDVVQVINHLNTRGSGEGEGEGEGSWRGWAGTGSSDPLVDDGFDTGLVGSHLLVTASSSGNQTLAGTTRTVAPTLVSSQPVYTGQPNADGRQVTRDRVAVTDLRGEDLDDLLEQIAGEVNDLAAMEEAHDAFFARYEV